jgi:hypothetical protein
MYANCAKCGLDSNSFWKTYYPIAEFCEHGDEHCGSHKAETLFFSCATVGFLEKHYLIFMCRL